MSSNIIDLQVYLNENPDIQPIKNIETPDEKICSCTSCGKNKVSQYWDDELEWYVILSNEEHCLNCQDKNYLA